MRHVFGFWSFFLSLDYLFTCLGLIVIMLNSRKIMKIMSTLNFVTPSAQQTMEQRYIEDVCQLYSRHCRQRTSVKNMPQNARMRITSQVYLFIYLFILSFTYLFINTRSYFNIFLYRSVVYYII